MEPHLVLKDEDDLELKSPSTKIPTLSAFVIPNKILTTCENSFPMIQKWWMCTGYHWYFFIFYSKLMGPLLKKLLEMVSSLKHYFCFFVNSVEANSLFLIRATLSKERKCFFLRDREHVFELFEVRVLPSVSNLLRLLLFIFFFKKKIISFNFWHSAGNLLLWAISSSLCKNLFDFQHLS